MAVKGPGSRVSAEATGMAISASSRIIRLNMRGIGLDAPKGR